MIQSAQLFGHYHMADAFFIWNVSNAFVGGDQRLPKPTACLVSEPMMA